ncbi:MAG: hypothetical protein KC517_02965 [Bacteroidetes bacterium]|jgi:hypothetical protein|nr:hypothetical protein [Bacteroidota bacterium]
MRKLLGTIVILCFSILSIGQVHDTTMYRQNKVKSVSTWVHMIAFEKSNDTCLTTVKEINRQGSPTYVKMDYHCQGWDVINELKYTYDENYFMSGLTTLQNDQIISELVVTVDSFGRILTEKNKFYEPFTEVEVRNMYFGEGKDADSMYAAEVSGTDTTYFMTKYTYGNSKLLKSNTTNATTNKPVNMLTNRYDQKGRLIRSEFIYFLGYDNDNITKYEYNNKDQIIKTKSELTDLVAEFYYTKDSLPTKTFYYNKFGALEREVWYKYTYYE